MIIDAHAHLVAPPSFYAHRGNLFVARGQYGKYAAKIADADLEKSAAQNISVMDAVGTDLQVLSPRPFMLVHGETRWEDIVTWTEDNNNLIARTVKMYPKRFRGVGGLPQATGAPVDTMFDEIKRCMNDLGFLGVLLNPDPSEGAGKTPPLGDSTGIRCTIFSASMTFPRTSTVAPVVDARPTTSTSLRKKVSRSRPSRDPTSSRVFQP